MKKIDSDYQCKNGDIIRLDFSIINLAKDSQITALLDKLATHQMLKIIEIKTEKSSFFRSTLSVTGEIRNNPFPVSLLITSITTIGVSVFVYLTISEIYLISEKAVPKVTDLVKSGTGLIVASGVLYLIFKVWK